MRHGLLPFENVFVHYVLTLHPLIKTFMQQQVSPKELSVEYVRILRLVLTIIDLIMKKIEAVRPK